MNLRINEGYYYQVIDKLLAVTMSSTASMNKKLALSEGIAEVSQDYGLENGFDELANCSIPEHDRLYMIDDFILVCLPKESIFNN